MKSRIGRNALVDFLWWGIHEGQNDSAAALLRLNPAGLLAQDEAAVKSITWAGQPLLP